MRPWLFQFGPLVLPTDARDGLNESRFNHSLRRILLMTWAARRRENKPPPKRYPFMFPKTCFDGKGYVVKRPDPVAAARNNKVIPMRKAGG